MYEQCKNHCLIKVDINSVVFGRVALLRLWMRSFLILLRSRVIFCPSSGEPLYNLKVLFIYLKDRSLMGLLI